MVEEKSTVVEDEAFVKKEMEGIPSVQPPIVNPVVPPVPPVVESVDLIAKANLAAENLQKANSRMEALIVRQEKLSVERTLGGVASAGGPSLTDEQKKDASAKAMLDGTGFEDLVFPKDKK